MQFARDAAALFFAHALLAGVEGAQFLVHGGEFIACAPLRGYIAQHRRHLEVAADVGLGDGRLNRELTAIATQAKNFQLRRHGARAFDGVGKRA